VAGGEAATAAAKGSETYAGLTSGTSEAGQPQAKRSSSRSEWYGGYGAETD
jgi:hypothetical protein